MTGVQTCALPISPEGIKPPAVPKPQLAKNKVLAAVSVAITFFTSAFPSVSS